MKTHFAKVSTWNVAGASWAHNTLEILESYLFAAKAFVGELAKEKILINLMYPPLQQLHGNILFC